MNLTIDLDREEDGRWIAEVLELPGVMCYGQTRDEAIGNAERLAIDVIADRISHGELQADEGVCGAPRFRPAPIMGEPLSRTILRDRGAR